MIPVASNDGGSDCSIIIATIMIVSLCKRTDVPIRLFCTRVSLLGVTGYDLIVE